MKGRGLAMFLPMCYIIAQIATMALFQGFWLANRSVYEKDGFGSHVRLRPHGACPHGISRPDHDRWRPILHRFLVAGIPGDRRWVVQQDGAVLA